MAQIVAVIAQRLFQSLWTESSNSAIQTGICSAKKITGLDVRESLRWISTGMVGASMHSSSNDIMGMAER